MIKNQTGPSLVSARPVRLFAAGIGAFSLITMSILLVVVPPATGYEPRVSSAFGPLLNYSMYGVVLGGILLIFSSEGNDWDIGKGFVLVTVGYLLWFFIPVFRGYLLYGRGRADILAHVGRTKTLVETGTLPDGAPYSAIYYLMGHLKLLDIGYVVLISALAFVLTLTYMIGTYSLLRSEGGIPQRSTLAAAVPLPLVFTSFHRSIHPAILSLFIVPVGLFLYYQTQKTGRIRYILPTLMAFLLIVQFHPVTSTLLFGIIVMADLVRSHTDGSFSRRFSAIPLVLFTVLLMWYVENGALVSLIVNLLYEPLGSPARSATATGISQTDLSPFRIVTRIIDLYGAPLLYIGAGGICLLLASVRGISGTITPRQLEYSLHYFAGAAIAGAFFVINLIVTSPIRSAKYLLFASTVLIGLIGPKDDPLRFPDRVGYLGLMIVIVVLTTSLLSVGSVYQPGNQLTEQEADGVEWHLEHFSTGYLTVSFNMGFKTQMYIQGAKEARGTSHVFQASNPDMQIPPHLGYHRNETVAGVLDQPSYVITKSHDYTFYKWYPRSRWDEKLTYTESDRNKMATDRAVRKTYTNGGFTVWQTA